MPSFFLVTSMRLLRSSETEGSRREQELFWAEHKGSGWRRVCKRMGGGSGKSNLQVEKEDAGNSLMVQGLVLQKGLIPPAPPPPPDREGDAMGLAAS